MTSATEITAFVVALAALVIALFQVIQQYMASSILRSKVGRAAIGPWAKRNRLRLNLSEFKIRQEYLEPVLTWERVVACLRAQKIAEQLFVASLQDRFRVGTSSGVAIGARGARYSRPPQLHLTRPGDEAQEEVSLASLSWVDRMAVKKHSKILANLYNARHAVSIASWSNMMATLVGNQLYLAGSTSSDPDDTAVRFTPQSLSYRDADTIPSTLDNPLMAVHFTNLISVGAALGMEVRSYNLHMPALHMSGQYCSIVSQEHSGVGIIARYTYSPDHVHHLQTCTPGEVDNLVKIAKGYLRIGDAGAHMTDWGYNSVDALFSILESRAGTEDWHQMEVGEQFRQQCEGDADIQWGERWSRPATTRVGFLLTHCGNPAVANSFPHSLLNEWPITDRASASRAAYKLIDDGIGIIEAPRDLPSSLNSADVVMNEYKLANNWGAEHGGIRGWSMSSGAEFVKRVSCCWKVDSQAEPVPILWDLRPLLQQGDLSPEWGRTYTSNRKRFSDEQSGWKADAITLCWIQCMMLDTWIARRVDLLMLGVTDEASVPVDSATAKDFARKAVEGGDKSKGKTTGWKRCRTLASTAAMP
ncbi:hypothetical protein B0H13DRAFT_1653253 [Mycena leptocephala]|nr:hypothetical protein B0H13DRAFT_1653253 [Mycena leptocephala]